MSKTTITAPRTIIQFENLNASYRCFPAKPFHGFPPPWAASVGGLIVLAHAANDGFFLRGALFQSPVYHFASLEFCLLRDPITILPFISTPAG
jgi:hypothetical protein